MSRTRRIFAVSVVTILFVVGPGASQEADNAAAAFAGTWSGRYDATEARRVYVMLVVTPLDTSRIHVRWSEIGIAGSPKEVETTGVVTPKGTLSFTADRIPYEVVSRGRERVLRFTSPWCRNCEVRLLTPGTICPDPRHPQPCADVVSHNLPFMFPTDGVAQVEFQSDPFYAVVLETVPRCSVTDDELRRIQKHFPANKVFTSRVGCGDEENITYTNVKPDHGFVAVYAGASLSEARRFLAQVNATHQFPGANIRKMQAVLVYP